MKRTKYDNIRVEVAVADPWFSTAKTATERERQEMRRCEDLKTEILRHCDNVENAVIAYTRTEVCEFCESQWEVDDAGIPMCCQEAVNDLAEVGA